MLGAEERRTVLVVIKRKSKLISGLTYKSQSYGHYIPTVRETRGKESEKRKSCQLPLFVGR